MAKRFHLFSVSMLDLNLSKKWCKNKIFQVYKKNYQKNHKLLYHMEIPYSVNARFTKSIF